MKFIFFTLSFIVIWLFIVCFGIGRRVSERDQTLCKIKLSDKLEEVKQVKDPYAIAIAYYNNSGLMCKTYCMIYSRDKEENDKIYYYDAPIYEYCGPDRYCNSNGKCMTINQFEKDQSLSIKNSKGNHENGKTKKNQLKQNVTINVTPKTTLFTTMEIATMETTTIRHDKKHRNHKTTIPPADQYEDEEEEEGEDE